MPNKAYIKGVRKERYLVNKARGHGLLAFRSAGSHSPIDVVIINKHRQTIDFIQAKPKNMSQKQKNMLISEFIYLNGRYKVRYLVI